jgi:protein involved in polysaccharide export with SLBB domain
MKFKFISLIIMSQLITVGLLQAQKINPGDGVRITFLDITDKISGDYFVQPDRQLQLPYIGIINTANKEFPVIKTEIISKYDSLYKRPDITVLALFRINIHGEVRNPGYYFVTQTENLTGIIALAGGYTSDANLDDMFILREDKEVQLDVESIIENANTVADIGLKSGDQIVIPRSFWADPGRFTWIFSLVAVAVTAVALFIK